VSEPLAAAVRRFLDDVTPAVESLGEGVTAIRADRLAGDVALEAFELVTAFVDTDGLHTDNELLALIATFGPLLETQLGRASPADVRRAGLVTGKRRWLERPSSLFELLVAGDRRNGTAAAWRYYDRAMALAHEVAATDTHVSHLELTALEDYRSRLLRALAAHGVGRSTREAVPAAGTSAEARPGEPHAAPATPPRPLEELYAELDALVGLEGVKAEVKLVANLIRVQAMRRERGLPVTVTSRHLVFTGNPGTGKTTVARLLAELYRTLGVGAKGHLVETDRGGLVAGFVGQTALKVKEVFDRALGGVLLIDEAYALARGREGDFGTEAVDTLVKLIEDHRDEVVVIAAGYPDEMATLLDSNPGIRSRFPKTIHFPDYTTDELVRIFGSLCEKNGYTLAEDARRALEARLGTEPRGKGFGNGRLARNVFEAAVAAQASRVLSIPDVTDEVLCALTAADIDAAA
jgi:ATPase family associated with various cellular activities (AAA)/AAA lid domain